MTEKPISMDNPIILEPTLFELSSPGRTGVTYPEPDVPVSSLPQSFLRKELPLPELAEVDVIRHYMHLSKFNYSVDGGFYPLGSCTMKYNPKINENTARLPGFAFSHPLQPIESVQGNLALMYTLQEWLKEISGFSAITLQPAAGAHGELTGVLIMRAYHQIRMEMWTWLPLKQNAMIPWSVSCLPIPTRLVFSTKTLKKWSIPSMPVEAWFMEMAQT
jgi:glycine cleavage system protein P-like pyridoxal-binding family